MIKILICVVLLLLLGVWVYLESTGFVVEKYNLTVDKKLDKDIHFVMISDLHDVDHGKKNKVVADAIRQINPEFVIFAGDMITASHSEGPIYEAVIEFIRDLSKDYTIYYGLGNHEVRIKECTEDYSGRFDKLKSDLGDAGVELIDNSSVLLDNLGIRIFGLSVSMDYYKRLRDNRIPDGYINDAIGNADNDNISILIAHNPVFYEEYIKWGADLILSGHLHGGIVRIPFLGGVISPQLKLFPKYDSGVFQDGKTTMLVSRGLGFHSIPIRINNKSEICDVYVKGR